MTKIGLETHVQLNTESKLFCPCENLAENKEPNTNTCPICLGHPGTRPALNEAAVEKALKVCESLNCSFPEKTRFARKSYFYPDMSKNFQITQYDQPLGQDGEIRIDGKKISIKRIHIEEDPAKLVHEGGKAGSSDSSLVDYNRAGTPLIEIVTEPDLESPEEARDYIQSLTKILEYLDVYSQESDFTIKSDANISLQEGNRVEVKNITGSKDVVKALKYEVSRQKQVLSNEGQVQKQTRKYNPDISATEKLRQKETEAEYGYIVEPDLPSLRLGQETLNSVKQDIPELPREKRERLSRQYNISEEQAKSIAATRKMSEDFEQLAEDTEDKILGTLFADTLRKVLNYNETGYDELNDQANDQRYCRKAVGRAAENLEQGNASDRTAEMYLRDAVEQPMNQDRETVPPEFDEEYMLESENQVRQIAEKVIEQNREAVEDYENGEEEAINFLIGQAMSEVGGASDPQETRSIIKEMIEESS